jgi:acetyl-CoA carboxylase biotin carboxyl carrier protein
MKPQDIADLKQLIEFLKEHQVAEFEVDRGDLKIRLKFNQAGQGRRRWAIWPGCWRRLRSGCKPAGCRRNGAGSAAAAPGGSACRGPGRGAAPGQVADCRHVLWLPSPGAAAFVAPGDRVDKGQVICIVEAMKLMNEIESDAAGEIVKCFVSNGQPIEYGQPLFP